MIIIIKSTSTFEWDEQKERENLEKHGLSFVEAQTAFQDPYCLIVEDGAHSINEKRWFCVGKITDGIVTVRFTYREGIIRIFGAGYWRKLRKVYQEQKEAV